MPEYTFLLCMNAFLNFNPSRYFLISALLFLLAGTLLGLLGALQYVYPSWLLQDFPFSRTRPLHVLLVINWIFSMAWSGVYAFVERESTTTVRYLMLARLHWLLLIFSTLICVFFYASGIFGGREYLEFPPFVGVPILIYAVLFFVWISKNINVKWSQAPVYYWMWMTGSVFFIFTFLESQLWQLPFFKNNVIRDVTVQWKALGSMVGSWNMLVYGAAFYMMDKIKGNTALSKSPKTFFFYFLGLTNLMFNWGHHTYVVPASPWIKQIAFVVSMTELILLWSIIHGWRNTLTEARKNFALIPYRFITAADFWIFINLILAILISIPAINQYTHGTHITVAHAMGATIGINTMLLFAAVLFQILPDIQTKSEAAFSVVKWGFWLTNSFLLLFWTSLILLGSSKAIEPSLTQQHFMFANKNLLITITISGLGLTTGLWLIALPLLRLNVMHRIKSDHLKATSN